MQNGMTAKLRRPLDFLAVSDHAEYIGVFPRIHDSDTEVLKTSLGQRWRMYMNSGNTKKIFDEFVELIARSDGSVLPTSVQSSIWHSVGETADRFNEPGRFSALIAYEWTSNDNGNNLHRVVLYRDGAALTSKHLPYSALDGKDPEGLWKALENYEAESGGSVIAIPHNSNLSNGLMFALKDFDGSPLSSDYAKTRLRWEPVVEVTQIKGDSETHPLLSPTDEFAEYERWDTNNVLHTQPKQNWMLKYEYARSALQSGLKLETEIGANPFKFGMIGSSDGHNAITSVTEDHYFGKFPESQPLPERALSRMGRGRFEWNWKLSASGLAAVWAKENTREEIFDAMKRREVYATTGSRIVVRFFGGWDYPAGSDLRSDFVDIGYAGGAPMGGDLANAPAGKSPTFIVAALKDLDEANLDRIQIIKGWLGRTGELRERIYDVALSGGRRIDPNSREAHPVGSTVNVADASYTNSIGAATLSATWVDPDFDPQEAAFYYARVIEIPKPRWTAYDAKYFGTTLPADVKMTIQDRAYTSPIWYSPSTAITEVTRASRSDIGTQAQAHHRFASSPINGG